MKKSVRDWVKVSPYVSVCLDGDFVRIESGISCFEMIRIDGRLHVGGNCYHKRSIIDLAFDKLQKKSFCKL